MIRARSLVRLLAPLLFLGTAFSSLWLTYVGRLVRTDETQSPLPANVTFEQNANESQHNPPTEESPLSRSQSTPQVKYTRMEKALINPRREGLSKIAIAVKSGVDVVRDRLPMQLTTFLKQFPNVLLIGDGNTTIGDLALVDTVAMSREILAFRDAPPVKVSKRQAQSVKDSKDQVIVDHENLGWQQDANKNTPGFKELWLQFPNADWYMMIDDDTYVLVDNLLDYTQSLDANRPYYLGTPHMQVGCDNVRTFGEGIPFAQGGSGILISRDAMKRAESVWDECIDKYRHCWAGDVRISLCLRDVGVFLDRSVSSGRFNAFPVSEAHGIGRNKPCQKPLTFHHLLPHHMQFLYDAEKSHEGHVNYANLFRSDIDQRLAKVQEDEHRAAMYHALGREPPATPDDPSDPLYKALYEGLEDLSLSTIEYDVDRRGNDYRHKPAESYQECLSKCVDDQKCMGWTFDGKHCWWKNAIPAPDSGAGSVSGVLRGRFVCTARG